MAIGRVARKLYAQQGEFGTVRKAYKEAFRRQMIANYAPANVIGRMFGFGSMFHTMAKRAFGTPEWNPRSLETGRPDIVPGQSQTRGRQGAARSTAMMRASDMVLADIAENTERTADAMENINKIAAVEQKKEDLGENFKREQDFEENLKKITPLSVEKMGPSSSVLEKNKQPSMLGDIIGSLIKEAAPYVLGGIGIALLTAKLTEWLTDGEWWKKNLVDPLATVIKQGIDGAIGAATSAVEGTVNSFWETDIGRFLLRPFQPTGSNPAREGKQNERFHAQAKRRGRKTVSKSMLENGEPVARGKIPKLNPMVPAASPPSSTPVSVAPVSSSAGGMSSDIPPEGQKLLNAISRTESGGAYNAIVGSGKYGAPATFSDYSDHPRIKGVGLTKPGGTWLKVNDPRQTTFSTAAGKYQITASTWDALRARYPDLTDFSPKNQDKAAWYLAQEVYKRRTGNDLTQDLKDSSKAGSIGRALSATWTSLPGGMESQVSASKFAQSMTSTTPPLNVAAATTAARSTQAAASTAAGATSFQSSMTAPQAMSTTIVNNLPPAAFGASPQMNESVDEFVTRVMVAMGIVVQT